MLKRTLQHIEWQGVTIFLGYIAVAVSLCHDGKPCLAASIGVIGLLLVGFAARNSYMQKSTALVDKYDERFFCEMRQERKSAGLFLLGEHSNSDELEDVLDFLESPIASKVEQGSLDAEQIYEVFYHWIRLYFQASKTFIADYRIKEPAAYASLEHLYDRTTKLEKKYRAELLRRECTEADLILSKEQLKEYLEQEAGLKTDPSDWEKAFRRKDVGK